MRIIVCSFLILLSSNIYSEAISAKDSTEVFGNLKGVSTNIKHPSTEVEENTITH
ncbi:MAG: hypothetical protein M3040_16430 [Bacteroidota bacterium]|nr:hypothetical protein [Bacteroidota bacterium]